jgi:endonuclease-3 related protein
VGAILTQNTAWTNVVKALEAIHEAGAMSLGRLLRVPQRRLESWIRPSGYFVQKSLKLKAFCRFAAGLGRPLDAWLRGEPLPRARAALLSVWGVGPETADSMLLYGGGRPVFVVDAYTRRIASRVGWTRAADGYDEVQAFFLRGLPRSAQLYNECHALLVELAKRCCLKTGPLCASCPIEEGCRHARVR